MNRDLLLAELLTSADPADVAMAEVLALFGELIVLLVQDRKLADEIFAKVRRLSQIAFVGGRVDAMREFCESFGDMNQEKH